MATAQDVIDRVRDLINDSPSAFVTTVRWTDDEILQWITDAQREIVKLKPEANPITDIFLVQDGISRQRISPDDAYALIRVEANAGDAGEEEPEAEGVLYVPGSTAQSIVTSVSGGININYAFDYDEVSYPRGAIITVVAFQRPTDIGTEAEATFDGLEQHNWMAYVGTAGFGSTRQHLGVFMRRVDELPDGESEINIAWEGLTAGVSCKHTTFMMYNVGNVSDGNLSGIESAYGGQVSENTPDGALNVIEGMAIAGASIQYTGGDAPARLFSITDDFEYDDLGSGSSALTNLGDGHYYRAAYHEFTSLESPLNELIAGIHVSVLRPICVLRLSPLDV